MKVVLLKDIKGLGRRYEVKKVKPGYCRNFLMPRKLAEPASEKTLLRTARLKAEEEKKQKTKIAELEKRAEKIKNLRLFFKLKTNKANTEIFGSISRHDIEKALAAEGCAAEKVILEKPIKILGEHKVEIDLGQGVKSLVAAVVEKE